MYISREREGVYIKKDRSFLGAKMQIFMYQRKIIIKMHSI